MSPENDLATPQACIDHMAQASLLLTSATRDSNDEILRVAEIHALIAVAMATYLQLDVGSSIERSV